MAVGVEVQVFCLRFPLLQFMVKYIPVRHFAKLRGVRRHASKILTKIVAQNHLYTELQPSIFIVNLFARHPVHNGRVALRHRVDA